MPSLRERFLYPRAGWLSLGLLAVMALAVAWSVQGARWLDHNPARQPSKNPAARATS